MSTRETQYGTRNEEFILVSRPLSRLDRQRLGCDTLTLIIGLDSEDLGGNNHLAYI